MGTPSVGEVMAGTVRCVHAGETAWVAAEKLTCVGVAALPVCDTDHRVLGEITRSDVAALVSAGRALRRTVVGEVLGDRPAVTVDVADSAERAVAIMTRRRRRRLPVVADGRLAGTIELAAAAVALANPDHRAERGPRGATPPR